MLRNLAVVVPFFQRERGILSRAVSSALAQKAVEEFPIIVVDDASPVPAREELEDLIEAYPGRIRIVNRTNGGPGAARNTGLDQVEAGTEYVAFLDSDDVWRDGHIASALSALDQGFDFYLSDYLPLGESTTHFKRCGLEPAAHPRLSPDIPVHRYEGDFLDREIAHWQVGTATVVYRFRRFSNVRFPEVFTYRADTIFWLLIVRQSNRIVFSSAQELTCGRGVNVSHSDPGEAALKRICGELRFRKWLLRHFQLTPDQRAKTRKIVEHRRTQFIEIAIHRLQHRQTLQPGLVTEFFSSDPLAALDVPPLIARMAWRKAFGPKKT